VNGHGGPAFCGLCGNQTPPGATFCGACGHPVADTVDSRPPQGRRRIWGAKPTKRTAGLSAAFVTLCLVLGFVAVTVYGHFRDKAVRDALASAQTAFDQVLAEFTSASDIEGLNRAGRVSESTSPVLEEELAAVEDSETDLAIAVAELIRAQAGLVSTLSGLSSLSAENLDSWQTISRALSEYSADVEDEAQELSDIDSSAGDGVHDPGEAVSHVRSEVGAFAASALSEVTAGLLQQLRTAGTTADIRQVAAEAARYDAAVSAALDGVDGQSADAQMVTDVGAVLTEVNRLAAIDAENLDAWPESRVALQLGLAKVPVLGDLGRRAVALLDSTIERAQQRLSDWKLAYDEAVADRADDRAQLADYEDLVRGQLQLYSQARTETSAFLDQTSDGYLAYEQISYFPEARQQRQRIRDALGYATVPDGMRDTHDRLVALLSDAVSVMAIAEANGFSWAFWCEGLIALPPGGCDFKDSKSWREFSAGSSRISAEFPNVQAKWAAALVRVQREVQQRSLPPRPEV
jgi:hypothetical protein